MWILITATALATLTVVIVYVNLTPDSPGITELIEVDPGVEDPEFRREVSSIFGTPIVDGNSVETLQNGIEIFPSMLSAIRGAQQSINFETFVYWQGDIAVEFSEALCERARAGIVVNVLLDWVGSRPMDNSLLDRMRECGVELTRYRPLSWYAIDRFNHRTHRKILVVDGEVGFTGGVGIAEEWTGDAQDGDHFRDTHYRVEGPVVAQLQRVFTQNWQKARGTLITGGRYFPVLEPRGGTAAQAVSSGPGQGNESAQALFLHAVAAARRTLDIGTPYFVPDPLVRKALHAAAERGVAIRILVPGQATDSNAARYASRRHWGELIERGVEIHEYRRTLYHCKLMIVDQHWTLVGSTNFDSRSLRLNDEINLNVLDPGFAAGQRRVFESDLTKGDQIDYPQWSSRPWLERLLELPTALIQGQL